MAERFEDRMNQSDSTLWRIERDPRLRTTIVGISVLSHAPSWKRLRRRISDVTDDVPRLTQKVIEPAFGVGTPRWIVDDGFDLDYHLRHVVAPQPGDLRTLLDIAGPIAMAAFDRDRPLWEFTLVDGLADGRAALIQKVHHSVTDGIGAIRMARLAYDEHASEAPAPSRRLQRHDARPSGLQLTVDTLAEQATDAAKLAVKTATAMPGAVNETVRHPLRVAATVTSTARSIGKMVQPASEPLSPIMRERGRSRRLAALDFPLHALKEAGHAAGGTLNDAYLAGLTGGMRRYHLHHDAVPDQLRVTMPINLRTKGDAIGNNKFTPARFVVPISEPDPRARMRQLGELARGERREPGLKFTDVVAGALNALPPQATTAVLGSMLVAIDFVATNVPGLDRPVHLAGATVEEQIAFAPPSGAAFSAALLSHLEHGALGFVIDTAAVPDPDVFIGCMADGFDEVIAVGDTS